LEFRLQAAVRLENRLKPVLLAEKDRLKPELQRTVA